MSKLSLYIRIGISIFSQKIGNMQPKFYNQLPIDEVRLCDAKGDCIEARGPNGAMLAGAAALLLVLVGVGYLWKKLA